MDNKLSNPESTLGTGARRKITDFAICLILGRYGILIAY